MRLSESIKICLMRWLAHEGKAFSDENISTHPLTVLTIRAILFVEW